MKKYKFGIRTRVFLSFGFLVIIFINLSFMLLYSFIESSFINNIKKDLQSNYIEIINQIGKNKDFLNGNNILNLPNSITKKLEKSKTFFHISLNDQNIKKIYKKGTFIYEGNIVLRGDLDRYTIILGKNIGNFENFRQNIIETGIFINIFSIFIVFIMTYFVANKVLNPLIKLSKYVLNYDIEKNSNPIKNKYGNSEIGIITESINKLIKKSKNILKSQQKFIQDSSHELKTPLMQIATNIDILEEKIKDEKSLEKIEKIKKSIENMNNIISDLSFVLRGEEKILKKENINLGNYLKDLVKQYKEDAEKKKIKIIVKEKQKLEVENNRYYLDRLFGNLVQNSIFYNNGNGEINIEILKNKVTLKDSGLGIEKEELEKIFSRFYRNDKSNIYNKNGSGLGLTIVKKICDDFEWDIKIKSEKGTGSEFEIIFHKDI